MFGWYILLHKLAKTFLSVLLGFVEFEFHVEATQIVFRSFRAQALQKVSITCIGINAVESLSTMA